MSSKINIICDEYDTYEELEKIFTSSKHYIQELEIKKKRLNKETKRQAHSDKITQKQLFEQKRQLKKMEKEQQVLKQTLTNIKKSTSKEHCIKYIIVKLDESVEQESYGELLKTTLTENNIDYKLIKDNPGVICWSRRIPTIENMIAKENIIDENNFLLILPFNMFESLVKTNKLKDYITTFSYNNNFKQLTITVFGAEWPTRHQEIANMKVEIVFKCYWIFLKNSVDLTWFIIRATKAIAQIPYSIEQEEKYKLQYFDESNKNKIKINKDGNGLDSLWKQMLTVFPGVSLETAEVITTKYPSLSILIKTYENSDKEDLLQNLPRKNSQGLSTTSYKRIGPELCKKFARYFTSEENILL